MNKMLVCLAVLTASVSALAESAWDFDSCMENMVRQFTCSVKGKNVFVDLESSSAQVDYKSAGQDRIYGVTVKNVAGGELYVTCDDSADLKSVTYVADGSSQVVACEQQ